MIPEITDEQLAQYYNLDAFVRRGLAHPEGRMALLREQKRQHPEIAVPEIDAANPLFEGQVKLANRIDELEKQLAEKEAERERQANMARLSEQFQHGRTVARKAGFADEGLEKLEQFMQDHGIGTHEAAIPYYEQLNPRPTPGISHGTRWDFFGQQPDDGLDLKPLYEGRDEEWLDHAVVDTLNKVRSGQITR